MAKDLMRYNLLAQEALRGVVREALKRAAGPEGLPGPHHFYITFRTKGAGVDIDDSLKEKYPEEMTIVLEHQFWDLEVGETEFEVTLKFASVPKYLKIPYRAISRFHDPSVGFHLQFDQVEGGDTAPTETKVTVSEKAEPKGESQAAAGDGAEVVSLDSFRKK